MVDREKQLDRLVKERDDLELKIDLEIFGCEIGGENGLRPSMASYADSIWAEEIETNPGLEDKLASARKIQQEIRGYDQQIADLKEEMAQEELL